MATHSNILAWRIPWTEEPGRLHSPRGRKESDTTERLLLTEAILSACSFSLWILMLIVWAVNLSKASIFPVTFIFQFTAFYESNVRHG